MVEVFRWNHEAFGAATGEATIEYRCQHCGAWNIKQPKSKVMALWIVGGVLTATTCLFGAPWLYFAWRAKSFDTRVPLMAGSPLPRIRFPGGPPQRTCGHCSGIATAIKVTRHRHKGVPTGDDFLYRCSGCKQQFETESWLGHVFSAVGGLVLVGVAFAFFFGAENAGWKYGGSLAMLLLFGLLGWQFTERIRNRFRHPEIPPPAI